MPVLFEYVLSDGRVTGKIANDGCSLIGLMSMLFVLIIEMRARYLIQFVYIYRSYKPIRLSWCHRSSLGWLQ